FSVVATINAAGEVTPPLIMFQGQRVPPAWVNGGGPPGALYAATESSFMQGPVFIRYIKVFHKHIVDNGKADGKRAVAQWARLLPHLRSNQVGDVAQHSAVSGSVALITQHAALRRGCVWELQEGDGVNIAVPRRNGGKMPVKSDMVNVMKDAFQLSFTPSQVKASFQGTGLWPVDMHRALNKLRGRGSQGPALQSTRSPSTDLPVAISEDLLASALGDRAVRKLKSQGHTITGLRVSTVMFGEYLKQREATRRPSISALAGGITQGGLLTCDEVMTRYEEDERQRRDEEQAKADRAAPRLAKQTTLPLPLQVVVNDGAGVVVEPRLVTKEEA
ncbi:unnamed protein product, partial [Sphacelaria rigidula]